MSTLRTTFGAVLAFAMLLAPVASADIVLLGGALVIHDSGDPGVSSNAGFTLRVDTTPNCNPGLVCADPYGEVAGTPFRIIFGAGPTCNPIPTDCALVGADVDGTFVAVAVTHNAAVTSVCVWNPTISCVGATATPTVSPNAIVLCAGVGPTSTWTQQPSVICDGLLVSTSPVCVKRASDGFEIVCQTAPNALP